MKVIATIQGCEIILHNDGHVSFIADCDIDCDGSGGNPDHDPYFQPDTSLHRDGEPLNAYQEPFIVVPPIIPKAVRGIVLGCKARVLYRETGRMHDAVVGDIGPTFKVGEASVRLAELVGIPHNPNTGGVSDFRMVLFELWPGVPAVVGRNSYQLKPWH